MPGIRTTETLTIAQGERRDYVLTTSADTAGITLTPPLIVYTSPPFPPPTASGPYPSLINNGVISVTVAGPSRAFAILLDQAIPAGTVGTQVINNGSVHFTNPTGSGTAVGFGSRPLNIVNNGDIVVSTFYDGSAVLGDSSTVENHGRMLVQGSNAFGISGRLSTSVVNSGEIHVIGASGAGAITFGPGAGYLNNTGLIVAEVLDLRFGGYGVSAEPLLHGVTIINSGEIRAAHAVHIVESGFNADSAYKSTTITNTGRIIGNIELAQGADTVVNSGLIDGDVWLGSNDDLFDHRGGAVTGFIDGGWGDDVLLLHGSASQFKVLGADSDYFIAGPNTHLRISNFEIIRFDDGSWIELTRLFGHTTADAAQDAPLPLATSPSPEEWWSPMIREPSPDHHWPTQTDAMFVLPSNSDWLF